MLTDLVIQQLIAATSRSGDLTHAIRSAKRHYMDFPYEAKDAVRTPFRKQLAEFNDAQKDSVWICLDQVIATAISNGECPSVAVADVIEDLETGWARFVLNDDNVNIEIHHWWEDKYMPISEVDRDTMVRLGLKYAAEVGSGSAGDAPTIMSQIVWDVVNARPFVPVEKIMTGGSQTTRRFADVGVEEARKLVEKYGFELHGVDNDIECWRSTKRERTHDDCCLIFGENYPLSMSMSSDVRGIQDAVTGETCTCVTCTNGRARRDAAKAHENKTKAAVN